MDAEDSDVVLTGFANGSPQKSPTAAADLHAAHAKYKVSTVHKSSTLNTHHPVQARARALQSARLGGTSLRHAL
jgi:hypothetical protein